MKSGRQQLYHRRWEEGLVWGFDRVVKFNLYATYLTLLHLGLVLPNPTSSSLKLRSKSALIMTDNNNANAQNAAAAAADREEIESYKKLFSSIRFHKSDDFPGLIRNDGHGTYSKIPPSEGLSWANSTEAWCAAHGAHGLLELVKLSAPLSDNGNEKLPLFPEYVNLEDLKNNWLAQRRYLVVIAKTSFAINLGMPSEQTLRAMTEPKVQVLFSLFSHAGFQA